MIRDQNFNFKMSVSIKIVSKSYLYLQRLITN